MANKYFLIILIFAFLNPFSLSAEDETSANSMFINNNFINLMTRGQNLIGVSIGWEYTSFFYSLLSLSMPMDFLPCDDADGGEIGGFPVPYLLFSLGFGFNLDLYSKNNASASAFGDSQLYIAYDLRQQAKLFSFKAQTREAGGGDGSEYCGRQNSGLDSADYFQISSGVTFRLGLRADFEVKPNSLKTDAVGFGFFAQYFLPFEEIFALEKAAYEKEAVNYKNSSPEIIWPELIEKQFAVGIFVSLSSYF